MLNILSLGQHLHCSMYRLTSNIVAGEQKCVHTDVLSWRAPKLKSMLFFISQNSVLLTLVKSMWNHKALLASDLHRAEWQAAHIPLCSSCYHWPHSCLNISPWHWLGHSDQISPLSFTPSGLHISSSLFGASPAIFWACVSVHMLLETSHYCGYFSYLCPAWLSTM